MSCLYVESLNNISFAGTLVVCQALSSTGLRREVWRREGEVFISDKTVNVIIKGTQRNNKKVVLV